MPENNINITFTSDSTNAIAGINAVTSAANKAVGNMVGMQAAGTALGMSLFKMGETVARETGVKFEEPSK